MHEELFFRLISHLIRDSASYCISRCAWTISVPDLLAAYSRHLSDLVQQLPALHKALHDGASKGWWRLEHDPQLGIDLVVLRSMVTLPVSGAITHGLQAPFPSSLPVLPKPEQGARLQPG